MAGVVYRGLAASGVRQGLSTVTRITAGNGGKCKNRVCVVGQEGFAAAATR